MDYSDPPLVETWGDVMLTSSVSFVLDFSRTSTLACRLFTDALWKQTKTPKNVV